MKLKDTSIVKIKRNFYLLLFFILGSLIGFNNWIINSLPDVKFLKNYQLTSTSRIYDRYGNYVTDIFLTRRLPVSIDTVPENIKNGFIAIEDKTFYRHHGFNFKRLIKVIILDFVKREKAQGASTITMQLARNLLLFTEKSFIRKIAEIYLSIKLERFLTKNEIFETYLNYIYFGYGNYGIGAASKYYFNKSLNELTLLESSSLVAMVKSPGLYSIYDNYENCMRRTRLVLKEMLKEGYIDSSKYSEAMNDTLKPVSKEERKILGPYYIETIKRIVSGILGNAYYNIGGYNIYTGMDLELQKIADSTTKISIENIERKYALKKKSDFGEITPSDITPYLQFSFVAMEPKTGDVLCIVGGRDIKESSLNRAIQTKRQVGSTFKIFLYTAAIDNGYNPSDFILDLPVIELINDKVYTPNNFDSTFLGKITLRKALYLSRNNAAIRLTKEVGPFTVMDYAYNLGIKSQIEPVLSIALGPSSVSLIEIVNAMSTIANYGDRIEPVIVKKIVDRNGNVIYENKPQRENVLSPQSAYIMIDMLKSVFDRGTAYPSRKMGFTRVAAGKTGTTNDFTDAWFIGFTPEIVAGVWVGYDIPKTIRIGASGAGCALPIWVDFMKAVYDTSGTNFFVKNSKNDFYIPEGIVYVKICSETGLLATSNCPHIIDEIFKIDNKPNEYCDLHKEKKNIKNFENLDKIGF